MPVITSYDSIIYYLKAVEYDMTFTLVTLLNHCLLTAIASVKISFGIFIGKKHFFVQYWRKMLHPSEWPVVEVAYRPSASLEAKMELKGRIRIARWPVGKTSDNARIMLSSLLRYSLV